MRPHRASSPWWPFFRGLFCTIRLSAACSLLVTFLPLPFTLCLCTRNIHSLNSVHSLLFCFFSLECSPRSLQSSVSEACGQSIWCIPQFYPLIRLHTAYVHLIYFHICFLSHFLPVLQNHICSMGTGPVHPSAHHPLKQYCVAFLASWKWMKVFMRNPPKRKARRVPASKLNPEV